MEPGHHSAYHIRTGKYEGKAGDIDNVSSIGIIYFYNNLIKHNANDLTLHRCSHPSNMSSCFVGSFFVFSSTVGALRTEKLLCVSI